MPLDDSPNPLLPAPHSAGAGALREGSRPARIFFATATSDRGGAETLLAELLKRLDRARFVCRVASMSGDGWLAQAARAAGIEADVWTSLGASAKIRALCRRMREFRPDIVHVFGLSAELPVRLFARRAAAGVRAIVDAAHSPIPGRPAAHVCLDRLTARRVDRFICVSETVAEMRRRREHWPAERIIVIPNGIELPPARALEAEERIQARRALRERLKLPADMPSNLAGPLLLMVANTRPMKGYGEALEALAALAPRFPGMRLVAVGRDVADGAYTRQARELGIADRVIWAGYQENPAAFYAGADIFLMPSYWEGCPTALLEAMSWGMPIVASRVGGIEEAARDREEALLVAPRDSAALAHAIERLAGAPANPLGDSNALARRLAENARRRAESRYSIDAMIDDHSRLYASLLADTR